MAKRLSPELLDRTVHSTFVIERHMLKRQISYKAEVAVLSVFIFLACFRAWDDQYTKAAAQSPAQPNVVVNVPAPPAAQVILQNPGQIAEPPRIGFEQTPLAANVGLGSRDVVKTPGVEAIVTAESEIDEPIFDASCDRPCTFSAYGGIDSSALATASRIGSSEIAYTVRFQIPRPIAKGKQVTFDFHSQDDQPIKLRYVHLAAKQQNKQ